MLKVRVRCLSLLLLFVALFAHALPAQITMIHLEENGDWYACSVSGLHGIGRDCGTKYEQMVFLGEILSVEQVKAEQRLTLRPLRVFKGEPQLGLQVITAQYRCLPAMKPGARWLFSLSRWSDGVLTLFYGSRSGPELEMKEQIALLERLETLPDSGIVKGYAHLKVEQNRETTDEPIAGMEIHLTQKEDDAIFKAVTNSEGKYQFPPLPKGKYALESNTRPGIWTQWEGEIEIEAHGCMDSDLDFRVDGQIAGKLIFPAEIDPGTKEVEALSVKEKGVIPRSTRTTSDGTFVLHGLKPGRYLVAYTFDVKVGRNFITHAVYYPGTSDRANAQFVEVHEGERTEGIEILVPRSALQP